MATTWDEKKKKPGRLPLILLGVFAVGCLVALVFLGDLARYQESAAVGESQAALRDKINAVPEYNAEIEAALHAAVKDFKSNHAW